MKRGGSRGEFAKADIESRLRIFSDLKRQGKQYFNAKVEFSSASEHDRAAIQRDWTARLLQILGYDRTASSIELEPGNLLPVLGTFEAFNKPYLWVVEGVDFKNTGDELLSLFRRRI